MELFPGEAQTLRKIVTEWTEHGERELEATFGVKGQVDATRFLTVAQRLRAKGYTALPQEDRLTITLADHTRFTLNGLGIIQQYCRDDRLAGKPFVAMIKDRAGMESNLDLEEYDVRVKVRREIPLGPDDSRVKDVLSTWAQQKKAFRLIRRWTFQGHGVLFDLSMVRTTKKDLKDNYIWVRNFKDQDILSAPPIYEIEVELIHEDATATPDKAINALISGIGEILRGIQKHTVLIRKSVQQKSLDAYRTLVDDDKFRGVAPVTLELKNMVRTPMEGDPNIRSGYNVTDKADGLRVLGFCDGKGELYLIDMALNVYRSGLKKEACKNSLVDGEWVTKAKDGTAIQQLLVFDIYTAPEEKKVDQLPFYSVMEDKETRYKALRAWIQTWNGGEGAKIIVPGINAKTRLQVGIKNFLFAQKDDKQIFTCAAQILSRPTPYNTDGLIFTPNDLPLPPKAGMGFLEQFKWKPAEDNTIDFLVLTEKSKQNPKEDDIITAIKPCANETIRYKTLRLFVGSSADPAYANPRDTILFERPLPSGRPGKGRRDYKPVLFNPSEFPDTEANKCYREIQTDPDTNEDYIMTERSLEPIQDKSIVEMRYDATQPPGWRWIPIRVRYDKTERLQRGILGRTLNSQMVAESVWNSIHDPITEMMIRTGSEQPSDKEISEMMGEGKCGEIQRRYYERKGQVTNLEIVKGLRNFHNHYIKERILLGSTLKTGNKTLLDMAVGRAADLQKWLRLGVGLVVGVDPAGQGITDTEDGAYRRYLNTIVGSRNRQVPPMIFVIGDSSRGYVSGKAGANDEEANMLRSIFGRVSPTAPVPPFVSRVGKDKLKEGADVVACMFALHYFFKDKDTFQGFLENIRDSLKVGGYFVACFFDGDKVFDTLKDLEKGETKTGKDKDTVIWNITKEYEGDELPNDDGGFGMAIDVEFISIGAEHREYLVPFKLFKDKMRSIGCDLLTQEDATALGMNNSTNMFEVSHAMAAAGGLKYPMVDSVKEYSFLNRWCIFRRYGDLTLEPVAEEGVTVEGVNELPTVTSVAALAAANASVAATVARPGVNGTIPAIATSATRPTSTAWNDVPVSGDAIRVPVVKELTVSSSVAPPSVYRADPTAPAAAAAPGIPGSLAQVMADATRTIPVERGIAAGPQKKYEANQIFQFYPDAAIQDKLKINDKGAGRWLAPFAPFPIQDPLDATVKYPTLEHYIAAMRYKVATDKPALAASIFGEDGTIHQKFLRDRQAATQGGKKPLTEEQDFELLRQEMVEVRAATRPQNIKKHRALLDESLWASQKDALLFEGLKQRWDRDQRLRMIVEAARSQEKYLLYYTGPTGTSDLGGVRRSDGAIEGENKVGRILMQLAGYPGAT